MECFLHLEILFLESDNEESDLFGIPISKKPQPILTDNNEDVDNRLSTANESSETDEQKHYGGISILGGTRKGLSDLEKAIAQRRKKLDYFDEPLDKDDDDDDDDDDDMNKPVRKPTETT